jgi:hypothetical protein
VSHGKYKKVVWGKFSKLERLSPMVSGLAITDKKMTAAVQFRRLAVPDKKMTTVGPGTKKRPP